MSETSEAAPEKTTPPAGLRGKKYAHLFRSDCRAERIPFSVESHPCWVDLRPMGKDSRDFYVRMAQRGSGQIDFAAALDHLVDSTVVDFQLARRVVLVGGQHGDWEECGLPAGSKPSALLKGELEPLPGFWDDLLVECQRVNGMLEPDPGN